jgi:hypothetical protein
MVVQRMPSIRSHRQHVVGGAVPVDGGHTENWIVPAYSLRHLRHRGRFQPQIHPSIATERDMVLMTSISRSRCASAEWRLGVVGDKEEIGEVAAEPRGDVGRSTFTATFCVRQSASPRRDAPCATKRRQPPVPG